VDQRDPSANNQAMSAAADLNVLFISISAAKPLSDGFGAHAGAKSILSP